jgi:hypothetical protein
MVRCGGRWTDATTFNPHGQATEILLAEDDEALV